jgi:hypothetical protein
MSIKTSRDLTIMGCILSTVPGQVMAHGYAGKRFFPAAMAVDHPFIADA